MSDFSAESKAFATIMYGRLGYAMMQLRQSENSGSELLAAEARAELKGMVETCYTATMLTNFVEMERLRNRCTKILNEVFGTDML